MNTDPTDTRHPHLDLEDLIARAAGQPVSDEARAHLAGCAQCQREADRWNLVADGVRILAVPWRRAALAAGSVAAALAVFAGAGEAAGVVHLSFGNGSPGAGGVTLTAVTGCAQIRQAEGTLEQVNGSSLVIKTAGGQPVTVTTTAATFVTKSGVLVPGEITDGASVTVRGPEPGGTLNALSVVIGKLSSTATPSGLVTVRGTVADATATGFTLAGASGSRIPVTTSAGTVVSIVHASLSQLSPGAAISALGQAEPNGTLSARAVAAIGQLPPGIGVHTSVSVKDCSPSSIDEALGALTATPVPAS